MVQKKQIFLLFFLSFSNHFAQFGEETLVENFMSLFLFSGRSSTWPKKLAGVFTLFHAPVELAGGYFSSTVSHFHPRLNRSKYYYPVTTANQLVPRQKL